MNDLDRKLHCNYINRCIDFIFCLKKICNLPREIILVIIENYWKWRSEPVFFIFRFKHYESYNLPINDIITKFKRIYPKLRYFNEDFNHLTNNLRFRNPLVDPQLPSLYEFKKYPLGLLIPGFLWDQDISDIKQTHLKSIQILNGFINDNLLFSTKIKYQYNENIDHWIMTSINDPNFLKVQNKI